MLKYLASGPAALLLAWGLTACGGGNVRVGIGIGIGFDDFPDRQPPVVSLAVNPSAGRAGDNVHLVAAAADDSGIDNVAFYRLDGSVAVLLGGDGQAPFEWDTPLPADGRTRTDFFARATDNTGERADSAVVTVTLQP